MIKSHVYRREPLYVPWSCEQEWLYVKQCIFDEQDNLTKGLEMMQTWLSCGRVPASVESTYNLMLCKMDISNFLNGPMEPSSTTVDQARMLRLSGTMAIIRFVNEMVDPEQQGTYAMPITRLAENIELPRLLVDIRHDGTHNTLPTLELLQYAIDMGLEWLYKVYWTPTEKWRDTFDQLVNMHIEKIVMELGGKDGKGGRDGDEQGNIEGNVEGDVEGDVKGNAKGNVKGNIKGNTKGNIKGNASKIVPKYLNEIEYLDKSFEIQRLFCHALLNSSLLYQNQTILTEILEILRKWSPDMLPIAIYEEWVDSNTITNGIELSTIAFVAKSVESIEAAKEFVSFCSKRIFEKTKDRAIAALKAFNSNLNLPIPNKLQGIIDLVTGSTINLGPSIGKEAIRSGGQHDDVNHASWFVPKICSISCIGEGSDLEFKQGLESQLDG